MREATVLVEPVDFANPRDAAQYLEVLDVYARDPMGAAQPLPPAVRERLTTDLARHPGVHCLLARHGETAVGLATCFLGYSTFRARPLLNVHDIAVLPEWRGRSVARHLLTAITEMGRRLDCCRITLEVREDNARALRLYQSAGFAPAHCNLFMEMPLEPV